MVGDEVPKLTPTETATPTVEQTLTPEQQKAAEMTQLLKQENESLGGHLLTVIPNGDGREVLLFNDFMSRDGVIRIYGVHPDLGAFKFRGPTAGAVAIEIDKKVNPGNPDRVLMDRVRKDQALFNIEGNDFRTLGGNDASKVSRIVDDLELQDWAGQHSKARQNAEKLLGEEQKRREIAQLQDKALEMLRSPAQPPATPEPNPDPAKSSGLVERLRM